MSHLGGLGRINFDKIASHFDEKGRWSPKQMGPIIEEIYQEFSQYQTVLEVGVGTGRIATPLQRRGIHLLGVDLSPGMVAEGTKRGLQDAILADVLYLPFKDKSIDATYSVDVLHLIDDWEGALGEISRVTRKAYYALVDQHVVRSPSYWRPFRRSGEKVVRLLTKTNGGLKRIIRATRRAYYTVANFWYEGSSPFGQYGRFLSEAGYAMDGSGMKELSLPSVIRPIRRLHLKTFTEDFRTADMVRNLERKLYSFQWNIPEAVHREGIESIGERSYEPISRRTTTFQLLHWDVDDLPHNG